MRWKPYLTGGSRADADEIREFPIRVSDIDLFDHVNNSVYWKVVEEFLAPHPELLEARCRSPSRARPPRSPTARSWRSLIYPPGSTEKFGPELTDRTVRTLTYVVGGEVKAVAAADFDVRSAPGTVIDLRN